jgi:hypothetical protein
MALIAGTSFFLLVFFLISLLDVDFLKKENRLHGYLCFFFYRLISISWPCLWIWRVNLGGLAPFWLSIIVFVWLIFLFHPSIFDLLRIEIHGFLILDAFDQGLTSKKKIDFFFFKKKRLSGFSLLLFLYGYPDLTTWSDGLDGLTRAGLSLFFSQLLFVLSFCIFNFKKKIII